MEGFGTSVPTADDTGGDMLFSKGRSGMYEEVLAHIAIDWYRFRPLR